MYYYTSGEGQANADLSYNQPVYLVNDQGVNQTNANVWQGMGRGNPGMPGTAGTQNVGNFPPPPTNPALRATPQQRPWDPSISNMSGAPNGNWPPGPVPGQWAPMPPNQPTAGWPIPAQQQPQHWGPGGQQPASYADQAKKSMMNRPQAATIQPGTNQPPPRFEVGAQNWGSKVDQGTPWDTGNLAQGQAVQGAQTPGGQPIQDGPPGKDWNPGQGGGTRWNPPVPPPGAPGAGWPPGAAPPALASNEWQPVQTAHRDPTGTSHWNAHPGAANANVPAGIVPPPGNSWCQPAPQIPQNDGPVLMQYDPNPQTPGPWVPPGQTEMNNDMMWHDPNPKQKKVQRDTGTSVWGDPGTQRGEIRRWKMTENEDYPVSAIAAPSGAGWDNLPLNIQPPPGAAENAAWAAAQQQQQHQQQNTDTSTSLDGTERWGAPPQQQASVNWGEVKVEENEIRDEFRQPIQREMAPNEIPLMEPLRSSERNIDGILTPQMAEQLQLAVNRGFINANLLNHHSQNQPLLVELYKRVMRLIEKEQKVVHLQRQGQQISKAEQDQIFYAIENAKSEIAEFQRSLLGAALPNGLTDGQSRLKQWKVTQNGMPDDSMAHLIGVVGDLNIKNVDMDKNMADWKVGSIDWSPPITGNDLDMKKEDSLSSKNTPTPQDDGIPEFVPGKKWEWRDPNKVAEDPNATPGTCKPNPLLAASIGGSTIAGGTNNGVSQANPTMSTESHSAKTNTSVSGWNNGVGPNSGFPISDQWNKQHQQTRSPLMMAPPMMPRPMAMPGPGAMGVPPRQFPPFMNGFWVVFPIMNMTEQQANNVCHRAGRLQNFIILPPKIACARYTEPIDAVMQRLKGDLMFGPNQVKILPDEEFEKMLRGSQGPPRGGAPMPPMNGWNNSQQQQPQDGPYNAGFDMSHHPPHGFQDDLQRPF